MHLANQNLPDYEQEEEDKDDDSLNDDDDDYDDSDGSFSFSSESDEGCSDKEEAQETDSDELDVGSEGPVEDPPFSMFNDEQQAAGNCIITRGLLQGDSVIRP